jgi:hypothetical protein
MISRIGEAARTSRPRLTTFLTSTARSASPRASVAHRCRGVQTRNRPRNGADSAPGFHPATRVGQHRPRWSAGLDRAAAPAGRRTAATVAHSVLLPRRSLTRTAGKVLTTTCLLDEVGRGGARAMRRRSRRLPGLSFEQSASASRGALGGILIPAVGLLRRPPSACMPPSNSRTPLALRPEIYVRFALDSQAAEAQSVIALDHWIVEVLGEALRYFWDGKTGKFAAQSVDFGVESVAAIAASREQACRLVVQRFSTRPRLQPGEALRLFEQFFRIKRVLGRRGVASARS